ncbi:coniferyl aldehyde dehydrogenase [Shewanella surugensis]|uniref:Aldehyde dehydrogenase n=1 Tax=Shewanella surugensis TaxID=212020 RepID=A0ABT0L9V6_9GAMM|nr:coniferyl aldehyde dehydrogenase [Shewanella surugensis]MCL1124502.1 coniferyl aldehyde dehydrogenase [Shewanella surugensis]
MNMAINENTATTLEQILLKQRTSYQLCSMPSLSHRMEQLKALKSALMTHQSSLQQALSEDFGHRSLDDSLISDIMPCVNNINYTLKNLKKWMKPSHRHAGMLLSPAKVKVHYQPLGVIGIIAPWNFPIMLSIGPLITAIAAGNRAMIKLSEFTPATNRQLTTLLSDIFDPSYVTCIQGETDVAAAFSALPFDHLIFTGSTTVGQHVMQAAAKNLTPVTLELGGKSPVIIADDISIDMAVERLIYGKCLNAGQICVAPDYILVPEHKQDTFIKVYKQQFNRMYGDIQHNKDYTSIINTRQFERLQQMLIDAKNKGAHIESANDEAIDTDSRKMPTQLITDITDDMLIVKDEIFGPLLPIIPYRQLNEAIEYINARPRPLALYLMSLNKTIQQQVLTQTHSGGMCINETVFHVAADDAPFGGIGPSGMGHYHGKEGFLTFSHAKTVLSRGKLNTGKFIHPPYGGKIGALALKTFLR